MTASPNATRKTKKYKIFPNKNVKNRLKNKNDWVVNRWDRKIKEPIRIAPKINIKFCVFSKKKREIKTSINKVYPRDRGVALEFSRTIIGVRIYKSCVTKAIKRL